MFRFSIAKLKPSSVLKLCILALHQLFLMVSLVIVKHRTIINLMLWTAVEVATVVSWHILQFVPG